jgi:hypothetical protein
MNTMRLFSSLIYMQRPFHFAISSRKAHLAPLAHDEWTIYMSMWDKFFEKPRGFCLTHRGTKFYQGRLET